MNFDKVISSDLVLTDFLTLFSDEKLYMIYMILLLLINRQPVSVFNTNFSSSKRYSSLDFLKIEILGSVRI